MYGTQTKRGIERPQGRFENDVKMYGTQTGNERGQSRQQFENDVKMYGTQTRFCYTLFALSLRMM